MASLKLFLDCRRLKSDGTAPLKISVSHLRQVRYVSLGVSLKPGMWDAARCSVADKHPSHLSLNNAIARLKLRAEDAFLSVVSSGSRYSLADIHGAVARAVQPGPEKPRPAKADHSLLFPAFERFAATKKPSTRLTYERTLVHLRACAAGKDLRFEDVKGRTPVIRIKLEAIDVQERSINPNKPHYGAAMKLGRSATKEAMKIVENIGAPEMTEIQKANIRELADILGIPQKEIRPMPYLDADQGASNPMKDVENCQSVVVAFEARRRGLNVYALPYSNDHQSASYALGERFQDAWLNPKTGKVIEPTVIRGNSDSEVIAKLKRQLNTDGRYLLGTNTKAGEGHLILIDVFNGKLIIRDEQKEEFYKLESLENIEYLEILKIDKAILN